MISNAPRYASVLLVALCAVVFIACGDAPGELIFDNPLSQGDSGDGTKDTSGQEPETPESMVLIPEGEFQMGDMFGGGYVYERPVHKVYLDDFYIDRYAVTNSQYAAFMNSYGKNADDSGYMFLACFQHLVESY